MSSKEEKPIDSAMETNNGNCDQVKIPQQQCVNTDASIGQSVENKTQEITKNTMIDSSSGQSSTELNDKLIEDLANKSIPCEMEVTESRLETESVKIETVKSIEMEKVNSETVTEAVQISSQQTQDTAEDSQQIIDKSPQNEPVAQQIEIVEEKSNKESIENESNMETKAIEGKSKPDKSPANKSIGSLGLLNQYASSSDEDDDSSSDDDDGASADSESETDDDTGDSSNNEVLGTPAVKDKELTTMANGILNSVMSRQNYREASSDS